jgi:hypothetical protein
VLDWLDATSVHNVSTDAAHNNKMPAPTAPQIDIHEDNIMPKISEVCCSLACKIAWSVGHGCKCDSG